jgi:hypothetical protein
LQDAGATYLCTVPSFLDKATEAAAQAKVREIFVFGEAAGATPFTELLQGDGQLPAGPSIRATMSPSCRTRAARWVGRRA